MNEFHYMVMNIIKASIMSLWSECMYVRNTLYMTCRCFDVPVLLYCMFPDVETRTQPVVIYRIYLITCILEGVDTDSSNEWNVNSAINLCRIEYGICMF